MIEKDLILGGISFIVTLAIVPLALRFARAHGLTDNPQNDSLKIHVRPIPFTGGAAMLLGSVLALFITHTTLMLSLPGTPALASILILSWIFGCIDDCGWQKRNNRNLGIKVLSQFALAALIALPLSFLPLAPWTVLWLPLLLTIMNAANMQDGLDGLLAGLSVISAIGFGISGYGVENFFITSLSAIFFGTTLAFLLWNFSPARLFMGDNGSYLVGSLMSLLFFALISYNIHFFIPGMLILGMPLANMLFVIARRILNGKSPLLGDRHHIYDILHRRTGSVRTAVLVNYGIHAIMVAAGVALVLL